MLNFKKKRGASSFPGSKVKVLAVVDRLTGPGVEPADWKVEPVRTLESTERNSLVKESSSADKMSHP